MQFYFLWGVSSISWSIKQTIRSVEKTHPDVLFDKLTCRSQPEFIDLWGLVWVLGMFSGLWLQPHSWLLKRRGCGFLLGVTTGKEVMFIKCAGSAGLSMLSEKAFLLCLSSPMFELLPECRIYFPWRNSTWQDCIFLSLLSHRKIGNAILFDDHSQ